MKRAESKVGHFVSPSPSPGPGTESLTSHLDEEQSEVSSYGSTYYPRPEINRALSGVSRGSEVKATFPTAPENVRLEKLFGFRKAQHLEGSFKPVVPEEASTPDGVVPHRIFVNHVDSYFGRHFVKYLQTQIYSFPREDGDESNIIEEDVEEESEEDAEEEEVGEEEDTQEESVVGMEGQRASSINVGEEENDIPDEEKEAFGDFDEDPFVFLLDEKTSSEEEMPDVESVFPPEHSEEVLRHFVTSENVGKVDVRKLKPEEFAELLDIESEEQRLRFLNSVLAKQKRRKAKVRKAKLEKRKLKELMRKIKYSKTHKPFEIVGTLRDELSPNERESEKFKYLKTVHIIDAITVDRDAFLKSILTCGTVVFNLIPRSNDQAEQAKMTLQVIGRVLRDMDREDEELFRKNVTPRTFLLISTMMTWANTIPLELEATESGQDDLPFLESDFYRREPHANFKRIYFVENEVLNYGQEFENKLKTLVIDTGILYGHEEEMFDFFFLHAWRCLGDTPVFDTGSNLLPLIHIDKLSEVLYKIIRRCPFIKHPLLFINERKCLTLQEICQTISVLGTGRVSRNPKEISLVSPRPGIDQVTFDYLTVDLNVEPQYLLDTLYPDFEDSFTKNQTLIAEEYIQAHRLQPLRILIDGLPLSGKTLLAKKLCKHYNLYYMTRDTIAGLYKEFLSERQNYLKARTLEKKPMEVEEAAADVEDEDDAVATNELELKEVQNKLLELWKIMHENDEHVRDDKVLVRILTDLLTFKRISNIGYVLDGWPSTYELAKEAFEESEEIAPNVYINLDIQESVCMERIYNLSEDYLKEHPVDETTLIDRLLAQRELAQTEPPMADFFQEDFSGTHEARLFKIDANQDINFFRLIFDIGSPRDKRFWIPINEDLKDEEEERPQPSEIQTEAPPSDCALQQAYLAAFAADQIARRARAKEYEDKIAAVYSDRLRRYAARYMPTLCRGLVETVRAQPQDPIDFLAEFLFRHNPEGRMLSDTQKKIFGTEHITVDDKETFRKLQEKVAGLQLTKRRPF